MYIRLYEQYKYWYIDTSVMRLKLDSKCNLQVFDNNALCRHVRAGLVQLRVRVRMSHAVTYPCAQTTLVMSCPYDKQRT